MKAKTKYLIAGLIALLIVLAAAAIGYTQTAVHPIQEDTEPLSIQMVSLGTADVTDSADLEALGETLRQCGGKRQMAPFSKIELDDAAISVDGKDADGPVHFVFKEDSGIFYRSGGSGYVVLDNPWELYDTIRAQLGV